jgi:hypothetical protein
LNLFISSCVPMVTRTLVGQAGQTRPMITLCSASARRNRRPDAPLPS